MSKKLRFLFYFVTALLIGSAAFLCYWIFLNVNNLTNIGLIESILTKYLPTYTDKFVGIIAMVSLPLQHILVLLSSAPFRTEIPRLLNKLGKYKQRLDIFVTLVSII